MDRRSIRARRDYTFVYGKIFMWASAAATVEHLKENRHPPPMWEPRAIGDTEDGTLVVFAVPPSETDPLDNKIWSVWSWREYRLATPEEVSAWKKASP